MHPMADRIRKSEFLNGDVAPSHTDMSFDGVKEESKNDGRVFHFSLIIIDYIIYIDFNYMMDPSFNYY